jgi:hypothetical protein
VQTRVLLLFYSAVESFYSQLLFVIIFPVWLFFKVQPTNFTMVCDTLLPCYGDTHGLTSISVTCDGLVGVDRFLTGGIFVV